MNRLLVVPLTCALLLALGEGAHGQQTGQAILFKPVSCVDTQGIGIEAFRMLIPADWTFSGGVQWVMDNPTVPAVVSLKVTSPRGDAELEGFPSRPFFWTNNQGLLAMFPVGAKYFGWEVCPPMSASEYLQKILIPRERGNVQNLRVLEVKPVPELVQAFAGQTQPTPGVSVTCDAAKAKIEYQLGNYVVEEEVYALVFATSYQFQTMSGMITNVNWGPDCQFSFKAVKGQMGNYSKMFQTMVKSVRVNLQWFNKYSQVVEFLIQCQIQQIRNTGRISEIIARTHDEISAGIMESYQKRQEVYDRINTNFSQYIRGVDQFYDPIKQQPVELPSGYGRAWTNALGQYLVSDSPSLNPNVGSNLTWQEMTLKQ